MEKNDFLKIKPMLLKEVSQAFNDRDYLYEIKFDGTRTLIFIDNGDIIIKSRRNVILNDVYPELLDIKKITKEKCIFDGEIVLMDKGVPSFSKLQERAKLKNKYRIDYMKDNYPVSFVCFDILYKNKDLTNLTLVERKKILNKFKDTDTFIKSKIFNNGIDLYKLVQKNNLEGIVAKRKDSLYFYDKRTNDWLKIKNLKEEDFFVCGYVLNKNKNVISVILGELLNNKYYFVGKVLLSHKNPIYENVLHEKHTKNYLENYKDEKCIFIKPKYKLKINYMERTKNNFLRQPFIKK